MELVLVLILVLTNKTEAGTEAGAQTGVEGTWLWGTIEMAAADGAAVVAEQPPLATARRASS